jgi:spore maturation protein CgeB
MKRLKILLAGPCFDDSFAMNVRSALVEMGHDVFGSEPKKLESHWSLPRYAARVLAERIRGDRPSGDDIALLRLARAIRPEIVLGLTWDVHNEILHEIGRICPGRRVLWWGDAPANSRRWGILSPGWDRVYVKDPDAVKKLILVGRSAALLHEAMNPKWHRVVADKAHDGVVVAGNYYAFRQALISRLLNDGVTFRLYGPRPPPWSLPEIKARHSGIYVTYEEKSRAFGEGLACLNTFHPSEGNSLNCRAFEIAGAGGLELIEYRPIVEQCFEPGKEVLAFSTYEELLDLIKRARQSPAEMSAIRAACARRALAEHTYRHRLERIIADIG